jgi:hypothetical protein
LAKLQGSKFMPFPISLTPRQRAAIGFLLIIIVLGWISFRMYRRLSDKPYVDFDAFYLAADAARTGADPYRAGTEMYIYPPMLAAWMSPLSNLTEIQAAWIWYGLSVMAMVGSLFLVWRTITQRFGFNLSVNDFLLTVGLTLLIWNPQVRWEFEQGQTDWLMLIGIAIALAYLDRSSLIVGLALGFAMNVKYLPLAFLVYFLIRRRWGHFIWSLIGTIVWGLLPSLVYGWEKNLVYLEHGLAGLGKLIGIQIEGQAGYVFPLTYDRSVTVPSAFARWAEQAGLGLPFIAGMSCAAALIICLIGAAMYRYHGIPLFQNRAGQSETTGMNASVASLEFLIIIALMLTFSPQAMLRHFFLVLPLVLTAVTMAWQGTSAVSRWSLWAALVLAVIGTVGADLVTPFGWREVWKACSTLSLGMLTLALVTLSAGLAHLSRPLTNKVETMFQQNLRNAA